MRFGVAYYPEHWPEEAWSVDAEMTQYAGLNAVRMGDLGWRKFEPAQGTYGFDPDYAEDAREVGLQGEWGICWRGRSWTASALGRPTSAF